MNRRKFFASIAAAGMVAFAGTSGLGRSLIVPREALIRPALLVTEDYNIGEDMMIIAASFRDASTGSVLYYAEEAPAVKYEGGSDEFRDRAAAAIAERMAA